MTAQAPPSVHAAASSRRIALPLDTAHPTPPDVARTTWSRHRWQGQAMGTTWSLQAYAPPSCASPVLLNAIQAVLDDAIALFSHWTDDSALGRLNAAPAGAWPCPPALCSMLARSLTLAAATQGAVDPTLGALVSLWGFGPPGPRDLARHGLPSDTEIAAAMAASGWRRLSVDLDTHRVAKPDGLLLDLGGIAKGWAVDQVSTRLCALGATVHVVEIGGELKARGLKADLQPWWVDLEALPDGEERHGPLRIALLDGAVATSGDYRHHVHWQGKRLAHTLDGRKGRPVDNDIAAVSVMHPEAMMADAYATALLVLGVEAGLRLADSLGLPARLLQRQGRQVVEHLSTALTAMLGDDA